MPISKRQLRLNNAIEQFNFWLKKNYPSDTPFKDYDLQKLREQAKFNDTTIHRYYEEHRSEIIKLRRKWGK